MKIRCPIYTVKFLTLNNIKVIALQYQSEQMEIPSVYLVCAGYYVC